MIFDKKTELKTFAVYEKRPDIFEMGGAFFSSKPNFTLSPIIMVQWNSGLFLKGNDPIGREPIFHWTMRVFPKIGLPQNGWFIMENLIKIDDLGVPLFSETSMIMGVSGWRIKVWGLLCLGWSNVSPLWIYELWFNFWRSQSTYQVAWWLVLDMEDMGVSLWR